MLGRIHFILRANQSIATAHGLELGAQRKSSFQYVFCAQKMYSGCHFCAMHPKRLKTGLLDSPGDLFMVKKKNRKIRPLVMEI